jgi:ferric-dicitrate binding protein FerR (iron transport regulator)
MTDHRTNAARSLERVGTLMREATPAASLQEHLEGRARLIAAVEKMPKPARSTRPSRARPVAVFVFAAAAAAGVVSFVRTRPTPIAWHVENAPVGAQGYVSIPPNASSARLVFEDGSHVSLAPGSRGRVAATTPVGAEVVLEQGQARVHVTHHERSSWLVDAGPFAVRVTGTDFLVAWAADAETLDVWMQSGRVVVRGPVLGDAQPLSAGQHLRARLRDATVQIDAAPEPAEGPGPLAALAPPAASPEPTHTAIPVERSPETGASMPPLLITPPATGWSKLVGAGDFARIVREAEAEGVAHAVATRPLGDLRALGDAARYLGNGPLARRALTAVRSRFPASAEARTAAFLLGRVAEEQDQAPDEAARWYDKYLAEAPGGEFAGNALGRKMLIASKLHGRDAARPLADRYLQRFPSGPYAAAARDLSP